MDRHCGTCTHAERACLDMVCEHCTEHEGVHRTWTEGEICGNYAESNWQRYFGTPEKAACSLDLEEWRDAAVRWYYKNDKQGRVTSHLLEWLEMEAE